MANFFQALGNTLMAGFGAPSKLAPISDDNIEPRGALPVHIKGRLSGYGERPNLSTVTNDITKLQAAIRMAERGDTGQLFTLYRDLTLGSSHIQSEFQKRKMVVVGQPYSLQPIDKKNPNDVKACAAIKQMIEGCDNWDTGISHLMDAALWPVAVVEKIFEPYVPQPDDAVPLRFTLKKLVPVPPVLLSYKLPYLAQGGFALPMKPEPPSIGLNGFPVVSAPQGLNGTLSQSLDTVWNPDEWEPDLRFYRCYPNGNVDYSWANLYAPDPMRHLIHRGTMINGVRDNYGGAMRSVMFWWFLASGNIEWWARASERFGAPFIVVKADTQSVDTVNFYQTALQLATKVFGIVINKNAEIELMKCDQNNMAEAFRLLHDTCNDEISKIIVGQTTSSNQKSGGGLGDGTAQVHETVRQDIRQCDQKILCNTVKHGLFKEFLQINGILGAPPNIVWGGLSESVAGQFADRLVKQRSAGLEPEDDALEHISEKLGMNVRHAPIPKEEAAIPGERVPKKKKKEANGQ